MSLEHLTDQQLIDRINTLERRVAELECSVADCHRARKTSSLCNMHWYRQRRHGAVGSADPIRVPHGKSGMKLYAVWEAMHQRCRNPRNAGFMNYGGRGISVCAEWRNFEVFLADMGECPEGYSLERVDVDGNYEPSNCKWADRSTQSINRRNVVGAASRFRGVTRAGSLWTSKVTLARKEFRIGNFRSEEETAWMYDQWAAQLHGEAAMTNFSYSPLEAV